MAATRTSKTLVSASALSSLVFSNDEPVAATPAQQDPKALRRERFIASCELQRKILAADIKGEKFSMTRKHYVIVKDDKGEPVKNTDGSVKKELKEEPSDKFRKWYWKSPDGTFALRPRYSVRVVELQAGKPTIVCGKTLQSVDNVLLSLITATTAGELDKPLMALQLGRKGA